MKTIVYEDTDRHGKFRGWWWADLMNHRTKHGPFETKSEAQDAARAAEITRAAGHFKMEPRRGHPR